MRYALLVYHQPGAMDHLAPEELLAAREEFYGLSSDPACLDGGPAAADLERDHASRVRRKAADHRRAIR